MKTTPAPSCEINHARKTTTLFDYTFISLWSRQEQIRYQPRYWLWPIQVPKGWGIVTQPFRMDDQSCWCQPPTKLEVVGQFSSTSKWDNTVESLLKKWATENAIIYLLFSQDGIQSEVVCYSMRLLFFARMHNIICREVVVNLEKGYFIHFCSSYGSRSNMSG